MDEALQRRIDKLAGECVEDMGDVFWEFVAQRDAQLGFMPPEQIALSRIVAALTCLANELDTRPTYSAILQQEYSGILARLPEPRDNSTITAALISEGEWTPEGARAVLRLATEYGVFVLRNALALAAAMDIEDGSAGL